MQGWGEMGKPSKFIINLPCSKGKQERRQVYFFFFCSSPVILSTDLALGSLAFSFVLSAYSSPLQRLISLILLAFLTSLVMLFFGSLLCLPFLLEGKLSLRLLSDFTGSINILTTVEDTRVLTLQFKHCVMTVTGSVVVSLDMFFFFSDLIAFDRMTNMECDKAVVVME